MMTMLKTFFTDYQLLRLKSDFFWTKNRFLCCIYQKKVYFWGVKFNILHEALYLW